MSRLTFFVVQLNGIECSTSTHAKKTTNVSELKTTCEFSDLQHRVQVTHEDGAGNENFQVVISTRNVQKAQAHAWPPRQRQDRHRVTGSFQMQEKGYRRNAAGKPPADTPVPTRRANGDARQCDGANGLKRKMPSWGMVLPTYLSLLGY